MHWVSTMLGMAICQLDKRAQPLLQVMSCLSHLSIMVMGVASWLERGVVWPIRTDILF